MKRRQSAIPENNKRLCKKDMLPRGWKQIHAILSSSWNAEKEISFYDDINNIVGFLILHHSFWVIFLVVVLGLTIYIQVLGSINGWMVALLFLGKKKLGYKLLWWYDAIKLLSPLQLRSLFEVLLTPGGLPLAVSFSSSLWYSRGPIV